MDTTGKPMITGGGAPQGADIMDATPLLRAIVCYGTGYDGVDLAAAAQRNIAVGHSPAADASSVADLAVTLMLATTKAFAGGRLVRSGNWSAAAQPPSPQAGNPGRRIGIFSMGEIGRKIASRLAAFETEVAYFSRSKCNVPCQYLPILEALAERCSERSCAAIATIAPTEYVKG